MMKKLLILDDGVSFFTNPTHLHKVYGRFWDAGVPTSIAITPALRGDARPADDETEYYGGIDRDKQGQEIPYNVSENKKLCDYLNVLADQRLVEICVRGYNGTIDEFDSDDDVLLQQKIEEGVATIRQALPDANITTFVLPQSHYSGTAVDLLSEYDFNICLPVPDNQSAFQISDLSDSRKSFTYPPILNAGYDNIKALMDSHDFIILRQSYWLFPQLLDEDEPQPLFDAWQNLVTDLLAHNDIEIETFSFV